MRCNSKLARKRGLLIGRISRPVIGRKPDGWNRWSLPRAQVVDFSPRAEMERNGKNVGTKNTKIKKTTQCKMQTRPNAKMQKRPNKKFKNTKIHAAQVVDFSSLPDGTQWQKCGNQMAFIDPKKTQMQKQPTENAKIQKNTQTQDTKCRKLVKIHE